MPSMALLALMLAMWLGARAPGGNETPLAKLTAAERAERLTADAEAACIYREGLSDVLTFVRARPDLFPVTPVTDAHLLGRTEREAVCGLWKALLDYHLGLDSIGRYYREFEALKKGPDQESAFLLSEATFLAQYRFALEFIAAAENDPGLHTLLNEAVPELGLPKGTYAEYKTRFLNAARAAEFGAFRAAVSAVDTGRPSELRGGIEADAAAIAKIGRGTGEALTARNALRNLKDSAFAAWFPVQAGVAEWMGDTKLRRPGGFLISPKQIAEMPSRLEPGDVLFVRREWYLSNIGLPGFWPHAALYIGTPEERRACFNDPAVQAWVRAHGVGDGEFESLLRTQYPGRYLQCAHPQAQGHRPRVVEAVSEGVIFSTLEHAADADSVAAVRPKLSPVEKASAILRAFSYIGRPYDFDFDFRTDSAIVCTELVYKAYEPTAELKGLKLQLVEIMGRLTLPANEMVRQFDEQHGTAAQQVDFLFFLDGQERQNHAVDATLTAFRQTWKRPKWRLLAPSSTTE